jgi:hypothetical protein
MSRRRRRGPSTATTEPVRARLVVMGVAIAPDAKDAVYAKREGVVSREIGGEHLLVPIKREVADMKSIFALMGVGVRVWKMLDGTHTLGQIHAALVAGFDVDEEEAWADLRGFVEHLGEQGLVERRS